MESETKMENTKTKSTRIQLLEAQLDVVNAQNARLSEENTLLRHKLNRLTNDGRSQSTVHVESKIRALQLEDERDRMYENLEKVKKKYNKLHEAYLEKVKRCKALEDMFKRQKTLTGLVMKSTLEQQQQLKAQKLNASADVAVNKTDTTALEAHITKLQTALDEAYDIIDELEFELESIDYLEQENQRMQQELTALKTANTQMKATTETSAKAADNSEDDSAPPPRYDDAMEQPESAADLYMRRRLVASSTYESFMFKDDDADSGTIERSALTESLVKNAEIESNCLRRELLKSRLQNTIRAKNDTQT